MTDYFQFYPRSTVRVNRNGRGGKSFLSILSKINLTVAVPISSGKCFLSILSKINFSQPPHVIGVTILSILSKINHTFTVESTRKITYTFNSIQDQRTVAIQVVAVAVQAFNSIQDQLYRKWRHFGGRNFTFNSIQDQPGVGPAHGGRR